MNDTFVITLTTENNLRVLQRVAGVFSRNRVNVEQLNICASTDANTSYFNMVVYGDDKTLNRVQQQLARIIELFAIQVSKNS